MATVTRATGPAEGRAAPAVDYPTFDADNHYYEATDAYTRHIDPTMANRPGGQAGQLG